MTLGQILKRKRIELGKSIEQIATATRIHVNSLKALEEDHYGELPARAFTRGFIISYCKALQLDPEQILKDYHDFLESKFGERPEKDHGHHGYAFEGKETEQNKRWMIISASAAAFFAIITLLFFKPQNHKHKEKHKELIAEEAEMTAAMNPSPSLIVEAGTTNTAVATTSTPTAANPIASPTTSPMASSSPSPSPSPTATPVVAPSASPAKAEIQVAVDPLNKGDSILPKDVGVKVVLLAMEDTLVHYHSDQRKPFSITLRKEKQLVIKGTELIKVQTDSPEHLKIKISLKNKPATTYSELKEKAIEVRADGTKTQTTPSEL